MSLRDRISDDLKHALIAQDATEISTLRLILTAITDRESAQRARAGPRTLGDDEILAMLTRMVELRVQSLRGYEEAGQFDLVAREQAEIDVIAAYLPRPMNPAEAEAVVEAALIELDARSIRDIGRVLAVLARRHAGRIDMQAAGRIVRARLAGGHRIEDPGAGAARQP